MTISQEGVPPERGVGETFRLLNNGSLDESPKLTIRTHKCESYILALLHRTFAVGQHIFVMGRGLWAQSAKRL